MFTGVTGHPFQLARHIDQRSDFFIRLVNFRQLRLGFKRLCQRHARVWRHQFRYTIDKTVRMAQNTANVANHCFRRHGSEGDDLRYRFTAIHLSDVIDNLVAFFHTEIDIEVRHGNTFGVEEAFEQQVEFQRIEIGDLQRISHQRSCARSTTWPYRHAVVFRPLDKFHYDQEVTRKAHLVDHLELNIQTLIVLRPTFGALLRVRE